MVTAMRTTIALIFCAHDISQKIKAVVVRVAVTIAQIFCAHGLIHAHRKSRVIGVCMAMCTNKPIIGKDAPGG